MAVTGNKVRVKAWYSLQQFSTYVFFMCSCTCMVPLSPDFALCSQALKFSHVAPWVDPEKGPQDNSDKAA